MPPEDESLREALGAAFDTVEPPTPVATPEPPAPKEPEVPAKPPEELIPPPPGEPEEPKEPKEPVAEKPPEEEPPKEPRFKAPGSWKPALREKWAAIPEDLQAEIIRRETDISNGMMSSADSRKFQQEFQQAIKPYEAMIAAGSGDPLVTVGNMMKTAAILQMGTPVQKAHAAATIIRDFGVDLPSLDSLLAGQTPPGYDPRVEQALQQQLAPVQQFMQQFKDAQTQQETNLIATAETSVQDFVTDGKHEFIDDVKDIMADMMELAAKRGQKLELQTAYDRAIMTHDEVSKVVTERKLKESTAAASRAAAEAKRKAVSVKGAPVSGGSGAATGTIRDSLLDAISQHET